MRSILLRRNGLNPTPRFDSDTMMAPFDWFNREVGRMFPATWDDENETVGAYPVDVREDDKHVYVDAELPGFKKNEIDITLHEGVLEISAQRNAQKVTDDKANKSAASSGKSHLTERRFTKVSRSFRLPTEVDPNKVDAKLTDGVLYLTLHKADQVMPRRIEVK